MAATLTDSGELTYLSIPIEKTEVTADGDIIVYGKATDGSVDSDGQIVDMDWSAKALREWLDTAGNVRVQHQAQRDPAGKGLEVSYGTDGHYVKSLIVEPVAKQLVSKGVLTAYSVGIARPVIEPDMTGRARGGIIKGGTLVELSLVDRPANKNCGIQLVKSAAADGAAEFVSKMWGHEMLIKSASTGADTVTPLTETEPSEETITPATETEPSEEVGVAKSVSIELPEDVTVAFSPRDLAKMLAQKAAASRDDHDDEDEDEDEADKAVEADLEKKKLRAAERKKIPSGQFAYISPSGERKLPLHDESHIRNALSRFNQTHFHSPEAKASAGRKIRAAARRHGIEVSEESNVAQTSKTTAEPAFEGAAPRFNDVEPPKKKKKKKTGDKSLLSEEVLLALAELGKRTVACDICKGTGMVDGKACKCVGTIKGLARMDADDHDTDSDADEDDKGIDKAPKNGGKKGKKMPPWLKDGDRDNDSDSEGSDNSNKSSKPTPADGVTGMHADPVPAHREPDGKYIESFEHDADLPTVPDASVKAVDEMDVALRFKSIGIGSELGILHDLCCPVYDPADVAKAHPAASFTSIDLMFFAQKAMDSAAGGSLEEAAKATQMWTHAQTLKSAGISDMLELQSEAHKAFRDANPGVSSFPTPGQITAQRYRRGPITAGHAADSPGAEGPHTASVPSEGISASQFGRGFISEGHAADSPANKSSVPTRVNYVPTIKDNVRAAMQAMHDHVAQTFPDVCCLSPEHVHSVSSRAVPTPVGHGTPAASAVKSQEPEVAAVAAPDARGVKAQKKLRKKLGKKVLSGKLTVDEARAKIGRRVAQKAGGQSMLGVTGAGASAGAGMKGEMLPVPADEAVVAKSATLTTLTTGSNPAWQYPVTWNLPVTPASPVSPDVIKSAVESAIAPVLEQLEAARKHNEELSKRLGALEDMPDPAVAPFRGVAVKNASARPGGVQTVAEIAERTQAMMLRELEAQWRNSPDPAQREAAWRSIQKMRGLNA